MLITALKKTSPEHVLITLEDGSEIRSTLSVVTDQMLFSGREIDEDAVERLRELSARSFAFEKAVSLLSYRQMSGKEMRTKLIQKGFSAEEAEAAVDRLYEYRMLDDSSYAAAVVRHYAQKGYGSARIRSELYRRGISREMIEETLEEELSSSELIDDRLDRLLRSKLKDPQDRDEVRKVTASLYRRGYSWEEIRSALNRYSCEFEEY